jgi:hypothetical protein
MLRMGGQPVDAPVTRSWTAKGTLRQAAPHSIDRVAAMCTFSSATLGLTMAAASPSRGLARSRAFHVKLQLVSILQSIAATSANDHREQLKCTRQPKRETDVFTRLFYKPPRRTGGRSAAASA